MTHALLSVMKKRIGAGLRRKAISSCSQWATMYREMATEGMSGRFSFRYHPWTKEMHDCESELMIGRKGAQLGFTEVALNKAFYAIDIKGSSVLYILPAATPDATDFSTGRFDPAIELSDHLGNLFSDTKNIGQKRAGNAILYIRGSRSRNQLKSIPASFVVADEYEEMNQKNVALIPERMMGQFNKQLFILSTPTVKGRGVDQLFQDSTQESFFFKCPSCGKWTTLVFPECLVIMADSVYEQKIRDSHLICKECKNILHHDRKSEWLSLDNTKWVPAQPDRISRGFTISQLYSFAAKPYELAIKFLNAQSNPTDEQEFFNNTLGLPHEVTGARITEKNLDERTGAYTKLLSAPPGLITMGIDVGKWIHYEVDEWQLGNCGESDVNLLANCRVIDENKVLDFESLDEIMKKFNVHSVVIDANPERRKALEFARRHLGRVHLCYYSEGMGSREIAITEDEQIVRVDRTSWLDVSLERFKTSKRITIPADTSLEYRKHIQSPVRIYRKDKNGNPVGMYVTGTKEEDHFAHCRNYAEIALNIAVTIGQNQNVTNIY